MTYKRKEVIGNCTLYLGDCAEVMTILDRFDAVVTDPPYGINQGAGFSGAVGFSGASGASKPIQRRSYEGGGWDKSTPDQACFDQILGLSDCHIIWGGNYFAGILPQNNFWLVWDKENTMPSFSDCELAWTSVKKNSVKRIVYRQNGCMSKEKERFHPTQKPVGVMEWCITHLPKDTQTILDPFMGSGTTGVACAKMGRKFTGIELDEDYFNIACERIKEAYKQPDLFVAQPQENKQDDLF